MKETGPQPPLRRDASQNRDRIVTAARALFAASVGEVSMDSIARLAGVGRATLYRNFEDIDALSAAILEENVSALEAAVTAEGDAPGSFERVLLSTIDEGLSCRALMPALAMKGGTKELQALSARVSRLLGRALKNAQRRREVRADLTPRDLTLLLAMVFSTVLAEPRARDLRARTRRALSFVLDGVRG